MLFIDEFIKSSLALFIIMDPFASLPVFLGLTKGQNDYQKFRSSLTATSIATIVLAGFVLFGPALMETMAISMPAFTIAGGILLLLTAIISFLGIEIGGSEAKVDIKIVVVAVPLIAGPGAMTTSIILANEYGLLTVFSAIGVVAIAIFAVLLLSRQISKLAGENGVEIASKIFSILLAAIAIEFIKNGGFQILTEWGLIS